MQLQCTVLYVCLVHVVMLRRLMLCHVISWKNYCDLTQHSSMKYDIV